MKYYIMIGFLTLGIILGVLASSLSNNIIAIATLFIGGAIGAMCMFIALRD